MWIDSQSNVTLHLIRKPKMIVWYSQYYDHIVRRKPHEEERRVEKSEEKSAPTKRWLLMMIGGGWSWTKCQNYEICDYYGNNISGGSLHLEADRTATALNKLHTGHTCIHDEGFNIITIFFAIILKEIIVWFWFRLLTLRRSLGRGRSMWRRRAKVLARNCEKRIGWRKRLLKKTKFWGNTDLSWSGFRGASDKDLSWVTLKSGSPTDFFKWVSREPIF